MREITPEMTQQILGFLPLLAFGLALFFTAFVCVVGAGFSLVPSAYQEASSEEEIAEGSVMTAPATRWRVAVVLAGLAVLTAVIGFFALSLLGHGITDLTGQVSQVPVDVAPADNTPHQ